MKRTKSNSKKQNQPFSANSKIKLYEDRNTLAWDTLFDGRTKTILRHDEISWKAKGILLLIHLHPEVFGDPKINKTKFILEHSKEGPDSITSGIKELEHLGLLYKETIRSQGPGRVVITGAIWHQGNGNVDHFEKREGLF